jgi:hypothetical protein
VGAEVTTVESSSPATVDVFYRARDLGPSPGRSTKLRALPHGRDLWTVAITVPIDLEPGLSQLFALVAPTVAPAG